MSLQKWPASPPHLLRVRVRVRVRVSYPITLTLALALTPALTPTLTLAPPHVMNWSVAPAWRHHVSGWGQLASSKTGPLAEDCAPAALLFALCPRTTRTRSCRS